MHPRRALDRSSYGLLICQEGAWRKRLELAENSLALKGRLGVGNERARDEWPRSRAEELAVYFVGKLSSGRLGPFQAAQFGHMGPLFSRARSIPGNQWQRMEDIRGSKHQAVVKRWNTAEAPTSK